MVDVVSIVEPIATDSFQESFLCETQTLHFIHVLEAWLSVDLNPFRSNGLSCPLLGIERTSVSDTSQKKRDLHQ